MALEIRDGDTVLVRCRVDDPMLNVGDTVLVRDSGGDLCEFKRDDIVSVEPRALKVGDKVTWGTGITAWELRVILEEGDVVVRLNGINRVVRLADLRLAD